MRPGGHEVRPGARNHQPKTVHALGVAVCHARPHQFRQMALQPGRIVGLHQVDQQPPAYVDTLDTSDVADPVSAMVDPLEHLLRAGV